MTAAEWVDLKTCDWDDLFILLRARFPKMGKYGSEPGADAPAIVQVMRDPDELARLAQELFKIECAYAAAMAPLIPKLEKASKDRADARRALSATIKDR